MRATGRISSSDVGEGASAWRGSGKRVPALARGTRRRGHARKSRAERDAGCRRCRCRHQTGCRVVDFQFTLHRRVRETEGMNENGSGRGGSIHYARRRNDATWRISRARRYFIVVRAMREKTLRKPWMSFLIRTRTGVALDGNEQSQ